MRSDTLLLLTASPEFDQDLTPPEHFLIPDSVFDDASLVTTSWTNGSRGNRSTYAFSDTRDEHLAKIEVAIQALIFVLALFGNGFVLLALRYRKRKTSRMHIFITHLSIADMLVAMLNILPQMAWDITFRFQGSDVVCRIVKYFQVMVIYLSTYVLVMTAVDRYRAICHPLSSRSWTNRKSYFLVGLAWIISFVLSIPQLAIFKMQQIHPGSEVMDCWANFHPEWTLRLYITMFSVTVFFLPSVVLCLLYGRICYVVWRNVYQRSADVPEHLRRTNRQQTFVTWPENGLVRYKFTGNGHIAVSPHRSRPEAGCCSFRARNHAMSGISRAKIKTIKLTIVVIIAYLVCWAPFIVTQMWWAYDDKAPYNSSTFVICLLLASLNSCCNPWIYMAFSESLVQEICPCCRRPARRKPLPYCNPRDRLRVTPSPRPDGGGGFGGGFGGGVGGADSDSDERRHQGEDIPLQERDRDECALRKGALLSRTASTKWSTLYRTDSRSSRHNNAILRFSHEHGIMAAANIAANWPYACRLDGGQPACPSPVIAMRTGTKGCQCRKCMEAMDYKSYKKGFLASWRERTSETAGDRAEENSKSSSSSSASRRRRDKGRKTNKPTQLQLSDRRRLFRTSRSFATDGQNISNDNIKFSSM